MKIFVLFCLKIITQTRSHKPNNEAFQFSPHSHPRKITNTSKQKSMIVVFYSSVGSIFKNKPSEWRLWRQNGDPHLSKRLWGASGRCRTSCAALFRVVFCNRVRRKIKLSKTFKDRQTDSHTNTLIIVSFEFFFLFHQNFIEFSRKSISAFKTPNPFGTWLRISTLLKFVTFFVLFLDTFFDKFPFP